MELKKRLVSLAAVTAMLSSFAAMSAEAVGTDRYTVTYEVLTAAHETADGTIVPAGAVAASVSVNRNTGFVADTLKLAVADGVTGVTNAQGLLAVDAGAVVEDGLVAAAISEDNDLICISAASARSCDDDGVIATVYLMPTDSSNTSDLLTVDTFEACTATAAAMTPAQPNWYIDYYYVGDASGDEQVNAVDASDILAALYAHGNGFYFGTSTGTPAVIYQYFPDAEYYAAPDANESYAIDNTDASLILTYSVEQGVGHDTQGFRPIGEARPYPHP